MTRYDGKPRKTYAELEEELQSAYGAMYKANETANKYKAELDALRSPAPAATVTGELISAAGRVLDDTAGQGLAPGGTSAVRDVNLLALREAYNKIGLPDVQPDDMDAAHSISNWLSAHVALGQSVRRELNTRIASAISQAYYLVTGMLRVNAGENYWALECAVELDSRWHDLKTDKEVAEIILSYAPIRRRLSQPAPIDAERAVVEAALTHAGVPFAGVDRPSFGMCDL